MQVGQHALRRLGLERRERWHGQVDGHRAVVAPQPRASRAARPARAHTGRGLLRARSAPDAGWRGTRPPLRFAACSPSANSSPMPPNGAGASDDAAADRLRRVGSAAAAAVVGAGALFPAAPRRPWLNVHPEPPRPEQGAMARIALPSDVIRAGVEEMAPRRRWSARGSSPSEGAERAAAAGLRARAAIADRQPPVAGAARRWPTTPTYSSAGRAGAGRSSAPCSARPPRASSTMRACPLLVVPAGTIRSRGPMLAGWDGSDGARAALAFAAEHLRERKLIVARGWRSPVRHTVRGSALLDSPVAMLHDYAEGLDDICREVAEGSAEEGAALPASWGCMRRHAPARPPAAIGTRCCSGALDSGRVRRAGRFARPRRGRRHRARLGHVRPRPRLCPAGAGRPRLTTDRLRGMPLMAPSRSVATVADPLIGR